MNLCLSRFRSAEFGVHNRVGEVSVRAVERARVVPGCPLKTTCTARSVRIREGSGRSRLNSRWETISRRPVAAVEQVNEDKCESMQKKKTKKFFSLALSPGLEEICWRVRFLFLSCFLISRRVAREKKDKQNDLVGLISTTSLLSLLQDIAATAERDRERERQRTARRVIALRCVDEETRTRKRILP